MRFQVKETCSLEYPDGEVWARRSECVWIDFDHSFWVQFMHGQRHKIKSPASDAPGDLVPLDERWLAKAEQSGAPVAPPAEKPKKKKPAKPAKAPVDREMSTGGAVTKDLPLNPEE